MRNEQREIKKIFLLILAFIFSSIFPTANRAFGSWEKPATSPPLSYDLRVRLEPEEAIITGEEEIIWENRTRDLVPDMLLHLYWNAFKNEASALFQEASREAGLTAIPVREGRWGWIDILAARLADGRDLKTSLEFVRSDNSSQDETVARLVFPEPVKPGENVHLYLSFRAKVPQQGVRAGYRGKAFFISQWYPKPGVYEEGRGWNCHAYHLNSEFYADFARFRLTITTPAGWVVGASGREVGRSLDPTGKLQTVTFEEDWIHDVAWTAAPDYLRYERNFIASREISETELKATAELLGLSPEELRLPDIKMVILLRPEHCDQLERHVRALTQAIKYYGLWFGPYPYQQITLVDPPYRTGSGGMEYPTLFTAGTSVLRSPEVLSPEGVVIHEFGHNYWYGLVANNEFEEAWLDEGINTYSTGKVIARAYGPGALPVAINGIPLAWFLRLPRYFDWELDRATAIQIVEFDPIVRDSWKFLNRASYGLNVYQRASTSLLTLEKLLGEGRMLRVLREFQRRFRFSHPRSEDFFRVAAELTGRDLSWFYREFFLSTHEFDYGISSLRSVPKKIKLRGIFEEEGVKKEVKQKDIAAARKEMGKKPSPEVYVTEVTARRYGEAKVSPHHPLSIKIVFEDGSEETRTWDGQDRWYRLRVEKPSRAKYAVVDPEGIWVIDSNWANNSRTISRSQGGVLRGAASLLFALQNVLLGLSALI